MMLGGPYLGSFPYLPPPPPPQVLLAKQLPFVNININLRDKPEWFKETTLGQVPVILYQGNIIPESFVNSDYLEEVSLIIFDNLIKYLKMVE